MPRRIRTSRPARRRAAHAPVRAGASQAAVRVRRALENHAHVDRLSRTFRALGDPTRSRMVYALSLGELCVTDLADALGASLSAVSHQLRILRDLEIVTVRRVGRRQRYALNEHAFGFCSPQSCNAWKQTLVPEVKPIPLAREES